MTSSKDTPTDTPTSQNDRFDRLLDDLDEMVKMMRALVSPEDTGVDQLLEELDRQMDRFDALITRAEGVETGFQATEQRIGARLQTLEKQISRVDRHQRALSEKLGLT